MRHGPTILLLLAAACGEVKLSSEPDAAPPLVADAAGGLAVDASVEPDDALVDGAPVIVGEWQTIDPFPELAAAPAIEQSPTAAPDGLEMFITRFRGVSPGNPATPLALWTATRATVMDPWGTPAPLPNSTGYRAPDLSADGRELYATRHPEIHVARRAARGAPWSAFTPAFPGSFSELSGDGLLIYYVAPGEEGNAISRRSRASLNAEWGPEERAEISYPIFPGLPDPDHDGPDWYKSIAIRGSVALLSSPSSEWAMPGAPIVATMRRDASGAWGEFRAVLSLGALHAEDCDLTSDAEAFCAVDTDGNGHVDSIVRATHRTR